MTDNYSSKEMNKRERERQLTVERELVEREREREKLNAPIGQSVGFERGRAY